ncbi:nitronate monooxygenase [Dissulfurispira sp.]|uniref:nitronate monooxygenase n=1 Tax=Dissulfurispira sp. TaxID=2817609 RepID=UPI002FDA7694
MLCFESALPELVIKGKRIKVPIIQGGMGVGVSLYPLASAVAKEGGLGIVSSACLDRLVSKRTGKKIQFIRGCIRGGFPRKGQKAVLPASI